MNNIFKRIPFSQENKIHEHTQVSLLLGRTTKGNLVCCFHSCLQVSKGAFGLKSQISSRRKSRLKLGKLLSLIGPIGNKLRQFSISLLLVFKEHHFFKTQGLLLTHPVQIHAENLVQPLHINICNKIPKTNFVAMKTCTWCTSKISHFSKTTLARKKTFTRIQA